MDACEKKENRQRAVLAPSVLRQISRQDPDYFYPQGNELKLILRERPLDQFTLAQSPKCRLPSSVYVYDAVSLQQINRPRPRVGQPYGSSDCTRAQYNRLPTGPGSPQPEKPTSKMLTQLSHRPRGGPAKAYVAGVTAFANHTDSPAEACEYQ